MLHHLQRNFEVYWDLAWDLSIYEQTIVFQGRHKDKLWIAFTYAGDGYQYNAVCDSGYMYSFIYLNDDIPESKNYLCFTSERVIWMLNYLKT